MFTPIPQDLWETIKRARQVKQLDINYSNGTGLSSPSLDHLEDLVRGVADDPAVRQALDRHKDIINHFRITGRIP